MITHKTEYMVRPNSQGEWQVIRIQHNQGYSAAIRKDVTVLATKPSQRSAAALCAKFRTHGVRVVTVYEPDM